MSSYGSNHSGYLQTSQYPPNPQAQQMPPQPPYPTTPGPAPTSQPQAFYPPTPQQHQQPVYSSSPASPWQQPAYSSSPQQHQQYPFYSTGPPQPSHRRSSSLSQHQRPTFASSAPISIPQPGGQHVFARPPSYSRSHGSHHSHHMHDPHAFADGEDGEQYGVLDEDTLRQYEKRYAKDRELEKRPTLGGSLMSVVKALGGKRD